MAGMGLNKVFGGLGRLLTLACGLLLVPGLAGACEACRNALAEDPAAAGFSRGIYLSIIVMLGMVFGLVAVLITYLVRQARSAEQ